MNWYLKVVRDNYANFNGRARRQEYWMFVLFNVLFSLGANIIDYVLGTSFISLLYGLAVLVPGLAVAVRRLHDIGKSGWMILIALIPLIGAIWLIVLFVTEGNKGSNEYGPDPKGTDEINQIGKPVE